MGYDKRLFWPHISFPDLHHIHENSAETLYRKYSIVNLLTNTKKL